MGVDTSRRLIDERHLKLVRAGQGDRGSGIERTVVRDDDRPPVLANDVHRLAAKGFSVLDKDIALGAILGDGGGGQNEVVLPALDWNTQFHALTGLKSPGGKYAVAGSTGLVKQFVG